MFILRKFWKLQNTGQNHISFIGLLMKLLIYKNLVKKILYKFKKILINWTIFHILKHKHYIISKWENIDQKLNIFDIFRLLFSTGPKT